MSKVQVKARVTVRKMTLIVGRAKAAAEEWNKILESVLLETCSLTATVDCLHRVTLYFNPTNIHYGPPSLLLKCCDHWIQVCFSCLRSNSSQVLCICTSEFVFNICWAMFSFGQQEHCCNVLGNGEVIILACFFTIFYILSQYLSTYLLSCIRNITSHPESNFVGQKYNVPPVTVSSRMLAEAVFRHSSATLTKC